MYLSYFVSDRFPFPQGSPGGPYRVFPGDAWGGPGLSGFRSNQAVNRVYTTRAALSGIGLGDTPAVNLPLLIGGAAVLALALGMFGKKKLRAYKGARLRRKRRQLSARIRQLEA